MLIKPPCSNEQTEHKKKEPRKVEVDFEKYPRPEGSLPGTLAYERPDLLEKWDYEKNNELGLDPLKLTYGSGKKIWWKCKTCGYSWLTTLHSRISHYKATGCPACANRVVTTTNNLAYLYPTIAADWDYNKNDTTPDKVIAHGRMKAWWKCKTCGYSWLATLHKRTSSGTNCPACTNKVVTATNSLAYKFPNIIEEWDYEKNGDIMPDNVMAGSNMKVWWKCKTCNYKWQAKVSSRTSSKSGCPNCNKGKRTSFPEQAIYFYIYKYFEDTVNTYKDLDFELDIYIPSKNVAIEYDGVKWHADKLLNDQEKADKCAQNSIKLIRVRELGLPDINNCIIINIKPNPSYKDLGTCIEYILKEYLGVEHPEININQDLGLINSQIEHKILNNSLTALYPEIAKEFMSEKNHTTPDKVAAGSGTKYWWKCKTCGYEWFAILSNRTSHEAGCPSCNGGTLLITENRTLAKLYPELLSEYSSENVKTANEIAAKSAKEVIWVCNNCNKSYIQKVVYRTSNGSGCPHCHVSYHPEFTKQRRYIDEQGNLIIEQKT